VKVLISTVGAYGHLHPLLPLARSLAAAGHEVAIATGPDLRPRAEAAGFTAFEAGMPISMAFQRMTERYPDREFDRLASHDILGWYLPHLFGEVLAPAAALDLESLIWRWRPDIVVHDSWEFGAPLAAAGAGIPSVSQTLGLHFDEDLLGRIAQSVAPLWRARGLPPDPTGGLHRDLCLDITPPGLQSALTALTDCCKPLRPVAPPALPGEVLPEWINHRRAVPLVYMTLGTNTNSDLSIFRAVVAGLAHVEVDVLMTIGQGNDPACIGPLPHNVHVENYVAQSLLLPLCSAVICHGGAGTTLAALASGLPVLVVPQGADQYVIAERVVASGAGLRLLPTEVNANSIRATVEALLGESAQGSNARRLQIEIAAMPGPEAAVESVEQIAVSSAAPHAGHHVRRLHMSRAWRR
jgi:UDP:flavonoid glycosyltransferase YjiC (YdhE family)